MNKKRIGFVDKNLDNFHANVYLSAVRGALAERGYTVAGATALESEAGKLWSAEKDVPYFASSEELAEHVDYFVILAPSNPEVHLQLCEEVFPLKKQTFVDKTFAPDLATAKQIFELADQFGVAVQSTSALRTTNVQEYLASEPNRLESMFITSAGPTFEEYGIHPVELAVSCLGEDVTSFIRLGNNSHPRILLTFSGNRHAMIDFNCDADVPFSATLVTEAGYRHLEVDTDTLFVAAAASILDFFDSGQAMIDRKETLAVRQILDLASQATTAGGPVEIDCE